MNDDHGVEKAASLDQVASNSSFPVDREIAVPSGKGSGNALYEFFDRNLRSESFRRVLLGLDKDGR